MSSELGKWLIGIGVLIVLGGAILFFFGDKLGWVGNLPGDFRVEKENFSFYFPVKTMIILSIILSILLTLIARFFRS